MGINQLKHLVPLMRSMQQGKGGEWAKREYQWKGNSATARQEQGQPHRKKSEPIEEEDKN